MRKHHGKLRVYMEVLMEPPFNIRTSSKFIEQKMVAYSK
jgi:hypothetical protein